MPNETVSFPGVLVAVQPTANAASARHEPLARLSGGLVLLRGAGARSDVFDLFRCNFRGARQAADMVIDIPRLTFENGVSPRSMNWGRCRRLRPSPCPPLVRNSERTATSNSCHLPAPGIRFPRWRAVDRAILTALVR
jgi:hypothetical protein